MTRFNNKYPYTDFHELNADWLLETVKDAEAEAKEASETVATYNDRLTTVEGDLAPIKSAMPGLASDVSGLKHDVGTMDSLITNTINPGLDTLKNEVETPSTGLLDRMTAAEGSISTLKNEVETPSTGLIDRVTALENQPSTGGVTEYLRFGTGGTPIDWDARITYTYLDEKIATTASADKTVNIVLVEDDELGTTWYYTLNEGEYQVSAGTPRGQFTFVCRKPVLDGNNVVTGYKTCTVTVNKNAATPTYAEVQEATDDDWVDVPLTAGTNVTINSYYCKRRGSLIVYDVFMKITNTTAPGEVLVDGFPELVTNPTSRLTVGRYKAYNASTFEAHFCGITTNLNYAFAMYNGDELRVWGSYYI